jgi:signal transduction histidine kinase
VDNLPEDSLERPQFDRIIELMRKVTDEGRNTLLGLRGRNGDKSDRIEESFANLRLIPVGKKEVNFRVVVEGTSRDLSPIAREEALYVGREALINAYRHSKADNIEAVVEYSPKYVRVLVRDDGNGIDDNFLRSGRVGHWGLTGMRERAENIGAELKIRSRSGAGTEVELLVPAHVAFDKPLSKRSFPWPFKPSKRHSPSPSEKEK